MKKNVPKINDKDTEIFRKELFEKAEANTVRNKDGKVVLTKDDPWREEDEWDEIYSDK